MNALPKYISLALALVCSWIALAGAQKAGAPRAFAEWFEACKDVPTNRKMKLNLPPRELLPLPKFAEFGDMLDSFYDRCVTGPLAQDKHWLGEVPTKETFFNLDKVPAFETPFQPFAQRLQLPAGSEVILHGDLHGDIRSLVYTLRALGEQGYLDGFKITKPNTHMLFLGDYADRGMYGVEVIYTLLRLKMANPDKVWLVRGNHEDVPMVAKYGFATEGEYKYGKDFKHRKVTRLYDFLPVVLYLGCENTYVQCNHGGIEPGYRVKALLQAGQEKRYELIGEIKRADYLKAHPGLYEQADDRTKRYLGLVYQNYIQKTATKPNHLGFLWTDYTLQSHEPALRMDLSRPGWTWGQKGTRQFLDYVSDQEGPRVQAIFRAHQHNRGRDPMMTRLIASRGVFEHWQAEDIQALTDSDVIAVREALDTEPIRAVTEGAVYTLNVSPDSMYGLTADYDFDTCVILEVQPELKDWKLKAINVTVPPGPDVLAEEAQPSTPASQN